MNRSYIKGFLVALLTILLFRGDIPVGGTAILAPFPGDSVSYDTGKLFIVSVAKDAGADLLVSSQWEVDVRIDVSSKSLKEEFPKTFVKLIPPLRRCSLSRLSTGFGGYSSRFHRVWLCRSGDRQHPLERTAIRRDGEKLRNKCSQ